MTLETISRIIEDYRRWTHQAQIEGTEELEQLENELAYWEMERTRLFGGTVNGLESGSALAAARDPKDILSV